MATKVYPLGTKAFIDNDMDFSADTIKAVLVDAADYTYSDAHDFLDDVAAGARATNGTGTLASKTVVRASNVITLDAADLTLTAVTGDPSEAVVVYKDTGAEATSPLLAYLELSAAVTPNGGNITLAFSASGLVTYTH